MGIKDLKHIHKTGFTIVELLIVIVVIAILASISVVAFNRVQERAKISVAQQDLKHMAKQMQLFKIDNGDYADATESPRDQLATIMKGAGVYKDTRAVETEWDAGIRPSKRFAFCTPQADSQKFAIVVDIPVLSNSFSSVGKTTYYIDQTGTIKSMVFTEEVSGIINSSLCAKATGTNGADWVGSWGVWSNSVPYSWAP